MLIPSHWCAVSGASVSCCGIGCWSWTGHWGFGVCCACKYCWRWPEIVANGVSPCGGAVSGDMVVAYAVGC